MTPRQRVSRRGFLTLLAGTTAALATRSFAAKGVKPSGRAAPKPAARPERGRDPVERAFQESLKSTRSTLEVIRRHPLPPGGDLSLVFKAIPRRKGAK